MSGRTRGYAHRVDIVAGPEAVWRALTDTESLRKWCSPEAQISAREGGHFRASVDRVTELEAHIDVLLPQRRMRLIYLPSEELPENSSPIVDDFMLDASDATRTIVRLLGSGFPADLESDTFYMRQRTGWERAIARLKVLVEQTVKADA
jgi:uncharacterized protein YndB with AHSA1/START domain